jgi:SAM-dependent methyltransferase
MPGRLYEATWGRVFALGYDRFMAASERAGLRARRRRLLSAAEGATLEIGAGTGLNLDLYPAGVSELVLTEPSAHMAARLRAKLAADPATSVVQASAERLPFETDRFDTVVATLVLCTVPEPAAALAEVGRVLRPGGRLLFLEHVRAPGPRLARWQDRFEGAWRLFGAGCHCNRDTAATIEASPLRIEELERGKIPRAMPLVRPMIVGAARLAE